MGFWHDAHTSVHENPSKHISGPQTHGYNVITARISFRITEYWLNVAFLELLHECM
jgi:hypothetical protein